MTSYRHTQIGWVMVWITLAVTALNAAIFWRTVARQGQTASILITTLLMIAVGVVFGRMTTEVRDGVFRFRFGPGLFGRRIPIADIVGCVPVRNRWWWGVGIRVTPRGVLYNVHGLDAVELTLKTGPSLRVGTDEPEALCAAIAAASAA